ncbi:MAG: tRNA lysidine(34) synthetase TilS [Flavobacteriaceae bacterium]|nr:tRNA lysidine(34) synthetase TilS [Flavobacteriaceae bacterium]
MLDLFKKHIDKEFSFLKSSKLLVCVSGGIDSMVLLNLFLKLEFSIGIAHCNFKLRGKESDLEEMFVKDYANENSLTFHSKSFVTKLTKHSTQMAARTLRYNWFNEILISEKYDYIITAHHLDDSLETFIMNLSRASGIEGLTGIKPINNNLIRPLLIFSKQQILNFAKKNKIRWRVDSSNNKNDYMRNKIRNKIIPLMKELHPKFLDQSKKSMDFLMGSKEILNKYCIDFKNRNFLSINNEIHIPKEIILKIESNSFIFELFKDYNFKTPEEIINLCSSISGKLIRSNSHTLLSDRDKIVLKSNSSKDDCIYSLNINGIIRPIVLSVSEGSFNCKMDSKSLLLNKEDIYFPLTLRKWKEGDYFYPNGMNGKKMISKYFKDQKMSYFDKQNQWILCNDDDVLWIIGMRFDKRKYRSDNANIKIQFNES